MGFRHTLYTIIRVDNLLCREENWKTKKLIIYLNSDDDLKKFILDEQTLRILRYIKDKEVEGSSTTKEETARYLNEEGIASRPTTLKIIQRLLHHKVIFDDKPPNRRNAFSELKLNPGFDWRALEIEMIHNYVKRTHFEFEGFENETTGSNTKLISELLETIENFYNQQVKASTKKSGREREPKIRAKIT